MKKTKQIASTLLITSVLLSSMAMPMQSYAKTLLTAPKSVSVSIKKNQYNIKFKKTKGAKKYYIYRSSERSGKYRRIAVVDSNRYVDENAKINRRYYYKVKSVNGRKKSKASLAKKTPAMLSKPVISSVVYGGHEYTNYRVAIAPQKKATGYYVYRADYEKGNYKYVGQTTTNEFVDTSADADYVQYYKVRAFNAGGRISAYSDPVCSVTGAFKDKLGGTCWKYNSNDKNIEVTRRTTLTPHGNVVYWVAEAKLKNDADFATEYAGGSWSRCTMGREGKERTTDMGKRHNAILAISGDGCGFSNREVGVADFLIRNGVPAYPYKEKTNNQEIGCHMKDGSFKIINSKNFISNEQLLELGVQDSFYFSEHLIADTVVNSKLDNEYLAPRTLLGQKPDGTWVFVVVDGRGCNDSVGMTMAESGNLMQSLGTNNAVNLDGGGSSTIAFNGYMLNTSSDGCERHVADCIYITR